MKTFNEFVEMKRVGHQIRECAELMVEMDVNPYDCIYESLKEIDPVLAEGWFDGVKNFAKNLWTGAGQFVGDVTKGAQTGYKRAADTVAGPVAKFDAAERALKNLVDVLQSDERFRNFRSSAQGFRGTVGDYLARVLASLQVDKAAVPQLMKTQVQQNYGTRQAAEDEASAGNTPAPAANPAVPLSAAAPQRPPMRVRGKRATG